MYYIQEMTWRSRFEITSEDFDNNFGKHKCHLCGEVVIAKRNRTNKNDHVCTNCVTARNTELKHIKKQEYLDSRKRY